MFDKMIKHNPLRDIVPAHLLLLLSITLVIVPHLIRTPLWLAICCFLVIFWRIFYELGRSRLPNRFIKFLLTLLAVFGILVSYQTIVGRSAGSAFLLLMLCLKLTEFKSQRDAFVMVYLSFFIVITGFLFSQSIPIAIYMILVVLLLTTTLIAFQHNSASQSVHFKIATQLLAFSFPLALCLFLLFPRVSGPLWGLPEDDYSARTGLSDKMSPGKISQLSNNDAVAFRVKFEGSVPSSQQMYWRGPVLWNFDGTTWSAPKKQRRAIRNLRYTPLSNPVNYQVTLEAHQQHWLFSLDLPATVPDGALISSELQIISRSPVTQVTRYHMQSYTVYHFPQRALYLTKYLQLDSDQSPRTKKLVSQIRAQSRSNQDFVNRVLNYFREQPFYYSRQAPLLFDDPVDEFLFTTRKGFCEHYASSFTVMMRIAGIPARVVTGYYGGEKNPLGDYMYVRQSDAHAWTEVYLDNQGWVRVDPTAVIPPDRIENTDDLVRIKPNSPLARTIMRNTSWLYRSYRGVTNFIDSVNNSWNQLVIGYNEKQQSSLFKAFGVPDITWKGLSSILFVLTTILLSVFSYLIFKTRRPTDPVIKTYRLFIKKVDRAGLQIREGETAQQIAKRVIESYPMSRATTLSIVRLYYSLHYGRHPTTAALTSFRQHVKTLNLGKKSQRVLFSDTETGKNTSQ